MSDEEFFVLPGILSVTDRALDFVRRFAGDVRRANMSAYRVWVFDWAPEQYLQESKEAPMVDLGPGIMLGGYKTSQVPVQFLQVMKGVRFAARIPPDVLAAAHEKLIDIEDSDGPIKEKVVLR